MTFANAWLQFGLAENFEMLVSSLRVVSNLWWCVFVCVFGCYLLSKCLAWTLIDFAKVYSKTSPKFIVN